jgi:hypothetical protein
MAWQALMVKVSPEFKAAVMEAADGNMSDFVRRVVADHIGYDLSIDDALETRGRPATYLSLDERRSARAVAERERYAHRKRVMQALMRHEQLANTDDLERWLAARGVVVEDDDVTESVDERQTA